MTMDQVAMWCGYGVMIVISALIFMVVTWCIVVALNDFSEDAARAARQTYWWARWERFHRIAKARKAIRARGKNGDV